MRGLVYLFLCGCAMTTSGTPPPSAPTAPSAQSPAEPPPTPEEQAFANDYQDAVARAERSDLAGAYDVLARRGAALEAQNQFGIAGICWNTAT